MKIALSNWMEPGWLEEFQRGCESLALDFTVVDIGADDWMAQLQGSDVFVWRLVMSNGTCMAQARAKIPLIEAMGIRCFPSAAMLWLYDDKVRESFFLRQCGYPTPSTSIFFDEGHARRFASAATYPLVAKSHCGASSSGVGLLRSSEEAGKFLDRVFRKPSLWDRFVRKYYYAPRLAKGDLLLALRYRYRDLVPRYVYLQEFIETDRDWRITTLGSNLVSAFARKNRSGDFRASGSGLWEKTSESDLPSAACDLALQISNAHGFTSMTYDFMLHDGRWVIGEMSYAFVLNRIYSDTLFRKTASGYRSETATAIGLMHLRAILESKSPDRQMPSNQGVNFLRDIPDHAGGNDAAA